MIVSGCCERRVALPEGPGNFRCSGSAIQAILLSDRKRSHPVGSTKETSRPSTSMLRVPPAAAQNLRAKPL